MKLFANNGSFGPKRSSPEIHSRRIADPQNTPAVPADPQNTPAVPADPQNA